MLIYLELSFVICVIWDYFQLDIGEILIDMNEIYDQVCVFMDIVMLDNVVKVKCYYDDVLLFFCFQIEYQIEIVYLCMVLLLLGGVIVIDYIEVFVVIDVNFVCVIKGVDIEEMVICMNFEVVDEVVCQLCLCDFGGLIVIDFIDMELVKSQCEVEQCLKDVFKYDCVCVQMGKILCFGLMELLCQCLCLVLLEGSYVMCLCCNGIGYICDIELFVLQVLWIIQEEVMKENIVVIYCQVLVEVIVFLLNEKCQEINKIELCFKVGIVLILNKYFDMLYYKFECLCYDDVCFDDLCVFWKMVEEVVCEFELEIGYSKWVVEVKLKQEVVVKGIMFECLVLSLVLQCLVEFVVVFVLVFVVVVSGGFIGWLKGLFGVLLVLVFVLVVLVLVKEQVVCLVCECMEKIEQCGGDCNCNCCGGVQQV